MVQDQDDPIAGIFRRLLEWRRFPGFQLERRLDAFLASYLLPVLGCFENTIGKLSCETTVVLPELPIAPVIADGRRHGHADYCVIDVVSNRVLLIEFKTDVASISEKQLCAYERYPTWGGVKELLRDVATSQGVARTGYGDLWRRVPSTVPDTIPIELCVLGPSGAKARLANRLELSRPRWTFLPFDGISTEFAEGGTPDDLFRAFAACLREVDDWGVSSGEVILQYEYRHGPIDHKRHGAFGQHINKVMQDLYEATVWKRTKVDLPGWPVKRDTHYHVRRSRVQWEALCAELGRRVQHWS